MFPLLIYGGLLFCLNDSAYTQFSSTLLSMLSTVSVIFYNLLTTLIMSFSTISTFFHTTISFIFYIFFTYLSKSWSYPDFSLFYFILIILYFSCVLLCVYSPFYIKTKSIFKLYFKSKIIFLFLNGIKQKKIMIYVKSRLIDFRKGKLK